MVDIETVADSVADSIVTETPPAEEQTETPAQNETEYDEAELYTYDGLKEAWNVVGELNVVCSMVDVPKDAKNIRRVQVEKNGFIPDVNFISKFKAEKQKIEVVDSARAVVKFKIGDEVEWQEVKEFVWKNRDGQYRKKFADGSVQYFWENGNLWKSSDSKNEFYRSGVAKYVEDEKGIVERNEDGVVVRFVDKVKMTESTVVEGGVLVRGVNGGVVRIE
jgi:hypothetical protein